MNLDPLDTFQEGRIQIELRNSNPNLIEFLSAEILNPSSRWFVANETVAFDKVDFSAASLSVAGSNALPAGAQNVLFATITYKRIKRFGKSELDFIFGADSLIDGRNLGIDVIAHYTFAPNFIAWIPEPSCLILASIGLIGLALRHRSLV